MLLSDVLCTGRGNHQVSPPPTDPSGCCRGMHLVQTFKADMPGGVPVDLATDRGLGATRVSGMLPCLDNAIPVCGPQSSGSSGVRAPSQGEGAGDHIKPNRKGVDSPPPCCYPQTHLVTSMTHPLFPTTTGSQAHHLAFWTTKTTTRQQAGRVTVRRRA